MQTNVAKAMNSESYTTSNYVNVSTSTDFEASNTATSLDGEIGSRIATSNTRSSNVVTYSGIRSAALVVDTVNGDTLYGVGTFSAASAGDLHLNVDLPGVNQTIGFDVEFDFEVTYSRR